MVRELTFNHSVSLNKDLGCRLGVKHNSYKGDLRMSNLKAEEEAFNTIIIMIMIVKAG